jgi:ribonucleotide monophosphatase NagD (HAD superfamily)
MAAILLDVDGVLHVSGEPIPGASEAVARLRAAGHRLRFVTNSTTRPRAELAADLRALRERVAATPSTTEHVARHAVASDDEWVVRRERDG